MALLTGLTMVAGPLQAGQETVDAWTEIAEPDSPHHEDFIPGPKFQFQAGALYRFAGQRFDESSEAFLITLDFNIPFHWDRENATWGAGLHVAFDGDGGPRLGPKLIWRKPHGLTRTGFLQLGACLYLISSDDSITSLAPTGEAVYGQVVMPGLYLEAEMGLSDVFSLTAAMEAIKVEYGPDTSTYGGLEGKTTDTHYYIGGKVGGWGGAILMAAGVAVAGSMVASSLN